MLIDDIQTFVKFLKNQGQSRYHTPEEIDDAINRASFDLFRQEEKIFEQSQIVTDTLRAFKVRNPFALVPSGIYALPSDYIRTTNIAYDAASVVATSIADEEAFTFCDPELNAATVAPEEEDREREISLLVDSEWLSRQSSVVLPPTKASPIARINGLNIDVLPKTIAPILYYLKKPITGKWNFTISGDGFTPIFNATGSTDLDWPEISHNEIIEKTISLLGITLRDATLSQFEQFQKGNNKE